MLQFIRSSISSWVIQGLFIVLIASFAIWGIGDIFRNSATNILVAQVENIDITASELEREFRNHITLLEQQRQISIPFEQARQLGLMDQALNTLIHRALYKLIAQEFGLVIGDDILRTRLRQESAFQDAYGIFDPTRFRFALQQTNMTEEGYLELLREQITIELLTASIVHGITIPDTLAQASYWFSHEQRGVEYMLLPFEPYQEEPTPDVLQSYYQQNTIRFTEPEYRKAVLALITVEQFLDTLDIPPETLHTEFQARREEFITQEQRTFYNIVLETFEEAQELIYLAQQKETDEQEADGFKAALETLDLEPTLLSRIAKEELPELGETVFSLAQAELSEPIPTSFGWHVLQVTQILPRQESHFEDIKDTLHHTLKQEQALDKVYEISNTFDQTLAQGYSLQEASEILSFPVITIPDVTSQGHDSYGNPVMPFDTYPEILQTLFSLEANQTSLLHEAEEGDIFYVVALESITPAQRTPLEDMTERVISEWQKEQQQQKNEQRASQLAVRLRNGAPLKNIAQEVQSDIHTIELFTRTTEPPPEPLTPGLVQRLFDVEKHGVVTQVQENGHIILQVSELHIPDTQDVPLEQYKADLSTSISHEFLQHFLNTVRQSYTVTIYQEVIDSLFAEEPLQPLI